MKQPMMSLAVVPGRIDRPCLACQLRVYAKSVTKPTLGGAVDGTVAPSAPPKSWALVAI